MSRVRPADLRRVPIFATLDDATLGALARCLRWRPVRVADALYRQGDPGDSMAFVLEGELVARVHLEHGGELEIESIPVGGIVGEMVCFEPALRSATVAAVAPSIVAELSRDALAGLRLGAPAVYARLVRRVIAVVAARLRQVNDRIDAELEDAALASGAPLTTDVPRPAERRADSRRPPASAPPTGDPAPTPPPAAERSSSGQGFARLLDRLLRRAK